MAYVVTPPTKLEEDDAIKGVEEAVRAATVAEGYADAASYAATVAARSEGDSLRHTARSRLAINQGLVVDKIARVAAEHPGFDLPRDRCGEEHRNSERGTFQGTLCHMSYKFV